MKAFPNTRLMQQAVSFDNDEGMDLRDYFAAKAMQALIAKEIKLNPHLMLYAGAAYEMADAMLKTREQ